MDLSAESLFQNFEKYRASLVIWLFDGYNVGGGFFLNFL